MSTPRKRVGERFPVTLRVKLKYKDVATFVEKFALNIGRGGVFIASKQLKAVGTVLRFELQLADGEPAVKGEGRVVWTREQDPAAPQNPHGMGIKFTRV